MDAMTGRASGAKKGVSCLSSNGCSSNVVEYGVCPAGAFWTELLRFSLHHYVRAQAFAPFSLGWALHERGGTLRAR